MTFVEQVNKDIAEAMRAKDQDKLGPLRMLKTALTLKRVEHGKDIDDNAARQVVSTLVKQRKDSVEQFTNAGRQDLADKEKAEIAVLSAYLPQRMGEAELQKEIDSIISETGASGAKDMGKVMAAARSRLAGKADMGAVSALVKSKLSG